MREMNYERWVVLAKLPGCEPAPIRGSMSPMYPTRSKARDACRVLRRDSYRFKPKSKGGLGYTCRPVKAEFTMRWES
jgi:hypothetical protein